MLTVPGLPLGKFLKYVGYYECTPCGQDEAVEEGNRVKNEDEDADPLDAFMTDLQAPNVEQVLSIELRQRNL